MENLNIGTTASLRKVLDEILRRSPVFQPVFKVAHQIQLPHWYVAGGCITQTIWNSKLGLNLLHGLKDVDLVYFKEGQSESDEEIERQRVKQILRDVPLPLDLINEARVHEWYPAKYGYEIPAYKSTEDGIMTWLPAFSIGVRPEGEKLTLFAPYGLEDAFEMRVRPNKMQITKEIYEKMLLRLKKDWPSITALNW